MIPSLPPGKPHAYTFPPFPVVPDGKTLKPFKEYKETGIQMEPNSEGQEIDGLGIPTIQLREQHATDYCKSNATPRCAKKPFKSRDHSGNVPQTGEWYERWNPNEKSYRTYDPNVNQIIRLLMVSNDFASKRYWPPQSVGLKDLYEQFLLFIGVKLTMPLWNRTDKSPIDSEDEEELAKNDPDYEADKVQVNVKNSDQKPMSTLRARPAYDLYDKTPVDVDSDEKVRQLIAAERDRAESRMLEFIENPERFVRVFLSSYMYQQALAWYDRNLLNAPRLLFFYIKFILTNHVFPEGSYHRGFEQTFEVIGIAQKELILTSKLSKALPDAFNLGCKECFAPVNVVPKREEEAIKATLGIDNIQIIDSSSLPPETDVDSDVGDGDKDGDWTTAAEVWTSSTDQETWSQTDFLMSLPCLGPTTFPLTHTTGVREVSVRRIKQVVPPLSSRSTPGVESVLKASFHRVVLEPWTGWEDPYEKVHDQPRILSAPEGTSHEPLSTDITIFVQDSVVEYLVVGMGIGATWVEIVRVDEFLEGRGEERFWYCEGQVKRVLTSYHVAEEESD